MEERRRFKRWDVSIPCSVLWRDRTIEGEITNLSFGGAFVSQATVLPAKGVQVIVKFAVKGADVELRGKITLSRRYWERTEEGRVGYFGLEFQDPEEAVQSMLAPVIDALIPGGSGQEQPSEN